MQYHFQNTIIINLGGSVIFPDEINGKLLLDWRNCIERFSKHYRFVIVVGGGKLARRYQEAAQEARDITRDESDWLGIYATRANAKLVQIAFGKRADAELIDCKEKIKPLTKRVTIACGWEPGSSTDYISALLAQAYDAKAIIMAGKPAFVYSKNPDQFVDARPFRELSWAEYWNIIPHKWAPGINAPIDPVCAKFCRANQISAIVVDGRNIKNIELLLKGEEFEGTIVANR